MLRAAVIGAAGVALVAGLLALRSDDEPQYVTATTVPGVGRIDGTLPRSTSAPVPKVGRLSVRELTDSHDVAFRAAERGEDSGPEEERATVREALGRHLFLVAVAKACNARRDAALVVYDHVFVDPARQPELDNLAVQVPAGCPRTRLRIDDWHGVQVDGDTASAVLRGGPERRVGDDWEERDFEWRAVLRRAGSEWKVAALSVKDLDYRD